MVSMLLGSCASPILYAEWLGGNSQAINVSQIENESEKFVEDNEGKRVIIEGFYAVAFLHDSCDFTTDSHPKSVFLDLQLPLDVFQGAANKWIVVSAIVEAPREIRHGGGDLVLVERKHSLAAILSDAELIAVDQSRDCKSDPSL